MPDQCAPGWCGVCRGTCFVSWNQTCRRREM